MRTTTVVKCLAIVLAALVLGTGCRNKPPAIPAQPAGPDTLRPNVTGSYASHTTDPNRDDVRYVWDWADGGFDTTAYQASGDSVTQDHAWTAEGAYDVRVKAQDIKENWSADWSDILTVYVTWAGGSGEPTAYAPFGPDSGLVGDYITFMATAIDPGGQDVRIKFLWDDGLTSLWSGWVASGDTVIDSVKYLSSGWKDVRCIAMDADSLLSDTSATKAFYAYQVNVKPDKPVVNGPARGIMNGPYYRFTAQSYDQNADSIQYRIFWGDGTSSDWTALIPHGTAAMDSLRPASASTWNIRAIARDQFGLESDTSDPFTFSVVGEGEIIWGLTYADEFVSSPALADVSERGENRLGVICGTTGGELLWFDAWQGEELWNAGIGYESWNSSPAVGTGNTMYFGNENGVIYAWTNEPDEKWAFLDDTSLVDDDMATTPVVDGNNLYIGGESKYLYKLSDDGFGASLVWKRMFRDELISSPALSGGNLFCTDDSGFVYSITTDNVVNWEFPTGGNITSSPAISDAGEIYLGTEQGWFWAIKTDGTEKWSYQQTGVNPGFTGSPVIGTTGDIVVGTENGKVFRFNDEDGTVIWEFAGADSAGFNSTPLVTADGYLYVVSDANIFYCLKEADGSLAWRVALTPPVYSHRSGRARSMAVDDVLPSPVVDQYGIIYVASNVNGLFAVAGRLGGTLANTAWPMFHHDAHHTGKTGSW